MMTTDPHTPGAKLDAGKPRLALVLGDFARALRAVSEVGTLGAVKYSDRGWLQVPDAQARYADAALRHLFAYFAGELYDPELGTPHLANAAWDLLAVLELTLRERESSPTTTSVPPAAADPENRTASEDNEVLEAATRPQNAFMRGFYP